VTLAGTDSDAVCSKHTKEAIEKHPNISVFRHPDHLPSGVHVESELFADLKNFSFKTIDLAKLPEDGIKALYGVNNDIILYWAHHEKLCLVDGYLAFMGMVILIHFLSHKLIIEQVVLIFASADGMSTNILFQTLILVTWIILSSPVRISIMQEFTISKMSPNGRTTNLIVPSILEWVGR
jgi:hypothetical protein